MRLRTRCRTSIQSQLEPSCSSNFRDLSWVDAPLPPYLSLRVLDRRLVCFKFANEDVDIKTTFIRRLFLLEFSVRVWEVCDQIGQTILCTVSQLAHVGLYVENAHDRVRGGGTVCHSVHCSVLMF